MWNLSFQKILQFKHNFILKLVILNVNVILPVIHYVSPRAILNKNKFENIIYTLCEY